MNTIEMRIAELVPYEGNPRKNDQAVDAVAASIKEFGFKVPVIVDRDNVIIAGHTRIKAAKKLGMETVPVVMADDLTPEQVRAFRLADNKTAELAEWDLEALERELAELKDAAEMQRFGFDAAEIEEMIKSVESREAQQDDFDVDEEEKKVRDEGAKTQPGDIWILGEHRLMCGDSTSSDDFIKLMDGGGEAQLTVTSPPYGVGKEYEDKGIEPWFTTMRPVIKNITQWSKVICWNIGDLLTTGTQFIEPTNLYSMQLFKEQGFETLWVRVWKKQGMNFGVGPYHLVTNKPVQQYEYIDCFSKNGDEEYNDQDYIWLSAYAEHSYKFVKRLTKEERKRWGYAGIWEMNTVRANSEHPAMFPVELPWRCIKMHSDEGDTILEPFCGSGTTIIACEQLNRVCFAMEKSPEYCDIAVRRWEKFTGKKGIKA